VFLSTKTYADLLVKYLVFLSNFNQIWIFLTDFSRSLHIKFHENLYDGSRAFTCERVGRWTDMTNLIGSFHENTYKPKKIHYFFLNLRMVDGMGHVPYTGKMWNAFKIEAAWQHTVTFVLILFFKKLVVKMFR